MKTTALRIIGYALVLCLVACGFWYWINITPQVKIPTPVMPSPNGYDYFVRAGAAFVSDDKGVDEVTDIEFVKGKKYPLAAKEAWLKKNAKAFQLLREGLKYPVLHPAVRSFSALFPEYAKFRGLSRALEIESHARGERGDWNGAVQSALVDYHFGNQVASGGPLIAGLVSVAIRAMSLRELGNLVPHTDTTTAKMAAFSMEKIYDQRYPSYKNWQEEKWLKIAATLELMKNPSQLLHNSSWRMGIIRAFDISIFDYPQVLIISKRKLLYNMAKSMDAKIENAQRPYLKQQPLTTSGYPLADAMLPDDKRARWNWARSDTQSVEIMTMYALRAYKMEKGHYPANLKELVPEYLKKVPIDPFDGIAPLHYQLQGNKYLLWSIGPDGVDNHGTPIINFNKKGRARHLLLFPDSKGDVVAGINIP